MDTRTIGTGLGKNHAVEIGDLFVGARRILIAVAFARQSGWQLLKKPLMEAIDNHTPTTIIVGTDFSQTDPYVIKKIMTLDKDNLHVSAFVVKASSRTFHPKIYYVERANGARAIIGSANLTKGGLGLNAEVSLLVEGSVQSLGLQDSALLRHWEGRWKLIPARDFDIDKYRKAFEKAKKANKNRVNASIGAVQGTRSQVGTPNFSLHKKHLLNISSVTRKSEISGRRANRKKAGAILDKLTKLQYSSSQKFLSDYDQLVSGPHYWHSGNLSRGKNVIVRNRGHFILMVRELKRILKQSDAEVFALGIELVRRVKGAGPNILTEILHTLDNRRFAVMNKNSVSGLRDAGITVYPSEPSKGNINPKMLADFHIDMRRLKTALGFKTFTEVDWLLNDMYWP